MRRAANACAVAAGNDGWVTSADGAIAGSVTGAKSLSGSYGIFCRFGMIEIGPLEAASRVYPSGAAFATCSEPMAPPAPGLFSTTMG